MKLVNHSIGIDLGTSTSEISIIRAHDDRCETLSHPGVNTPILPSVVAWDTEMKEFVVGSGAERFPNCVREIKRKMVTPNEKMLFGDKEYLPQQISAMILLQLKKTLGITLGMSESELKDTVFDIYLTCPAIFPDPARAATLAAGQDAGFNIKRLISEPTAAALFYAVEENRPIEGRVMVFDFGGGTLDITIGDCALEEGERSIDVICSAGDPELGGKDIDEVLKEYVKSRLIEDYPNAEVNTKSENLLKEAVIRAKKELSTQTKTTIYIPGFARANRMPIDLDMGLTRNQFEEILNSNVLAGEAAAATGVTNEAKKGSIVSRILGCIREIFVNNPIEKRSIDYLLFVGGSSYIPYVQQIVKDELGIADENIRLRTPDLAVTRGAAYFAAGMGTATQVAPYGLGLELLDYKYAPFVTPQSRIPQDFVRDDLLLVDENQRSVIFRLFQDLSGKATSTKKLTDGSNRCEDPNVWDCDISCEINNIPPSTTGVPHGILGVARYSADGVVEFELSIPALPELGSVKMSYDVRVRNSNGDTSVTDVAIR